MSFHPQYLSIFSKSQAFVMRGDGPLPFHYRNFIAIMAAGRHQCSYLIQQQVAEFLIQGGDERWLSGLEAIPAKLRDLYELNKILAHRPWLITKHHIEVYVVSVLVSLGLVVVREGRHLALGRWNVPFFFFFAR